VLGVFACKGGPHLWESSDIKSNPSSCLQYREMRDDQAPPGPYGMNSLEDEKRMDVLFAAVLGGQSVTGGLAQRMYLSIHILE